MGLGQPNASSAPLVALRMTGNLAANVPGENLVIPEVPPATIATKDGLLMQKGVKSAQIVLQAIFRRMRVKVSVNLLREDDTHLLGRLQPLAHRVGTVHRRL